VREAARGWSWFWEDRLDLEALAWEVAELLDDVKLADARHASATAKSVQLWQAGWPKDVLCSVPGIGEICAAATRAWWGDGLQLRSAKAAAAFVGLNPSNWESGLSASPSRPITKEGPPALRLAYYQAANIARRHDPGLAAHYRTLMVERRHNHISANCAVARKLACRAWAVLQSGRPFEVRDLDGKVIDQPTATALAAELAVPDRRPPPRPGHDAPRTPLGLSEAVALSEPAQKGGTEKPRRGPRKLPLQRSCEPLSHRGPVPKHHPLSARMANPPPPGGLLVALTHRDGPRLDS
jgi:hypothetical protein